MDERSILELAQRGDRDAFAKLVEMYHAPCMRFAIRLLGSVEDAEDAVQDSFLRAYRALPSYQHRGYFKAWLFQIVVNRCRSAGTRRRAREDRQVPLEGIDLPVLDSPGDPLLEKTLRTMLSRLEPGQREAVLLKYGEEMSYAEMAEATGEKESALKMRVKRARDFLRQLLKETLLV